MCNIIVLDPGIMIPYDRLETCVFNNPHGYGLILRDAEHKKLQVIRKCPEKGSDPKEIFDLLEDNKDIQRILHMRWRTDGPINLENTHPFPAYISDERQVYFMHNGMLHDFKPKSASITYENNIKVEIPAENASDSKKFNDEYLAPYLLRHVGEKGKADISDSIFHKNVSKMWGTGESKGILIANDLNPVLINGKAWKEMDFGTGKFMSSNDTYWANLLRGPVFEERKKAKEEEEARTRVSNFSNRSNDRIISNLKDINLKPKPLLSENLGRIMEDYDIYNDDGLAALENMTHVEIEALVERSGPAAVDLIVYLTSRFADLYGKYSRLSTFMKTNKLDTDKIEDDIEVKKAA